MKLIYYKSYLLLWLKIHIDLIAFLGISPEEVSYVYLRRNKIPDRS